MYDAIVIGSRCAGAPTAMLLARAGRRVLVVDRATFPSDVLSGHTIQPAGVARLQRWGLLDKVRATGVPYRSTVRFDFGPVVLQGDPVPVDGINDAVCIRRTILDTLLTAEAADAGAEVRQGFTVKELLWEDGRVVGIRGRDASGATVAERARIVIGADGARSFVARSVGATTYNEVPAKTVNIYSYFRGLDLDALHLYVRPGRFFVATPTNDGLTFVNQTVPAHEAPRYKGRLAEAFAETIAEVPHLAERVNAGERVERFRWAPPGDAFFRIPSGPGWALVGDAGYHLDPITAQGMLDALPRRRAAGRRRRPRPQRQPQRRAARLPARPGHRGDAHVRAHRRAGRRRGATIARHAGAAPAPRWQPDPHVSLPGPHRRHRPDPRVLQPREPRGHRGRAQAAAA